MRKNMKQKKKWGRKGQARKEKNKKKEIRKKGDTDGMTNNS